MITPKDLKMPRKFESWRPGQLELIMRIAETLQENKKFLLDAPTGVGKSLIGIAVSRLLANADDVMAVMSDSNRPKPTCIYLTSTKQLQDQVCADFPFAKQVKGRSNYPCAKHPTKYPTVNAEDCNRDSSESSVCKSCQYTLAKVAAAAAPVSVLNTAYFLAESNFSPRPYFSEADLIVIDEVDCLEKELLSFVGFSLSEKRIRSFKLLPPAVTDSIPVWTEWLLTALPIVEQQLLDEGLQLSMTDDRHWTLNDFQTQRKCSIKNKWVSKVHQFLLEVNDTWVLEERKTEEGPAWEFKPVDVKAYAYNYLWRHSDRFLGMSGTILDPKIMAGELNINNYVYHALASPYPVDNRPVYFAPVADVTRDKMTTELPKLAAAVQKLMGRYPLEKMLIHTVSYQIRDYLMANIQSKRFITHSSEDRAAVLDLFKRSKDPMVVLSPSFDRGVDLPGDQCRCTVICKVPYPNMGDKQVAARMKAPGGDEWYLARTVQTVLQMSGRGVRAADDYCDTFILDKQFSKLYNRAKWLFPAWWTDAIKDKVASPRNLWEHKGIEF